MIHKPGTDDSWHGVIEPGGRYPPEPGRYHLYIGLFCPFAHRVNLVRHIKGLQDFISISVVKPYPKGDDKGWPGWKFPSDEDEYPGATTDALFGSQYLHEVYFKDDRDYKGRYSVPLLWDTKTNTIVNTESAELLRTFPESFNSIIPDNFAAIDLYPESLRPEIDAISVWMQRDLNGGVYKAGFATDQETYNMSVPPIFAALNKLEKIIAKNGGPYLLGKQLTELDLRLYPTAIRFDTIYVQHFKTNLATIRLSYPNLNNWLKHLYWRVPGFRATTDFRHIKENYTKSHAGINPHAITPLGPWPDIEEGVEEDWGSLNIGEVRMPEVLEAEARL